MEAQGGSPSVDEGEEHDGWFACSETVRRPRVHVEPKARFRVEMLAIHDELEPAFRDLDDGCSGCLMLAQSLSCVETKDRDLGSTVAKDHARHDRAGLNVDRGSDVRKYEV